MFGFFRKKKPIVVPAVTPMPRYRHRVSGAVPIAPARSASDSSDNTGAFVAAVLLSNNHDNVAAPASTPAPAQAFESGGGGNFGGGGAGGGWSSSDSGSSSSSTSSDGGGGGGGGGGDIRLLTSFDALASGRSMANKRSRAARYADHTPDFA